MSEELNAKPLFIFKTLKNTELGAESAYVDSDGSIVFRDVLKEVTESMLASYPRTQLGCWTPNRAALRYTREEAEGRALRRFDNGEAIDLDGLLALAG